MVQTEECARCKKLPLIGFLLQKIREGIQRDGASADIIDESWSRVIMVYISAPGVQQAEVGINNSPSLEAP